MTEPVARILVADDQQSILDDFARLLDAPPAPDAALDELEAALGGTPIAPIAAAARYEVRYVRNGVEAVREVGAAAAAGRPFSVAFLDVQMPPGIDGVETAAQAWQHQADLEIVLCTAYADHAWPTITARLDAADQLVILRKPFDPIEVRQLAACLTEKARRGRALAQRVVALEARVARAARLQVELERNQKFDALGRLAAGIAHEINTPTTYIQGSLQFLGDGFAQITAALHAQRARLVLAGAADPSGDAVAALVAEIPAAIADALEGVGRITAIVRSVRDYAHPGKGVREPVDVNRQIRAAVELARNEYRHDAELVLDLGELPLVPGVADELGCAILNLVINAAQAIHSARTAGGPRGRIAITSRASAGLVTVDIADTGTGISAADRERVFDPFYTTKPIGQGTGQGLAIARSTIVEGYRGSLTFESEPGRTVFRLALPIAADERAA